MSISGAPARLQIPDGETTSSRPDHVRQLQLRAGGSPFHSVR